MSEHKSSRLAGDLHLYCTGADVVIEAVRSDGNVGALWSAGQVVQSAPWDHDRVHVGMVHLYMDRSQTIELRDALSRLIAKDA